MSTTIESVTASIAEHAAHAPEFAPRRFFSNGHLQTILGNFLPRTHSLPPAESVLVEVSPTTNTHIASQVRCDCHWQPAEVRAARPTAIIVHGLEGSSTSQYVIGNANKLWQTGANIIRMNMRNCGGTEALTPTLYHSGLSTDVEAVMHHFVALFSLTSISLIGYSMGGNLVLKLAGDLAASAPPQLRSVIGISPAIDLGPSADALHAPQNRIYEMKFLRDLLARYLRKAALFPQTYDPALARAIRSIRQFDDRVTAFYSGFTGADDYYHRAAAARVLDRIAVPTLILNAADDPFVRILPDSREKIAANTNITFLETTHGGHCAFLTTPVDGYDGYWAEHTLLRFLLSKSAS
ncbi:YheT family hydrolase [Edaphobacter aggregans]|uniref:YheT family hydrolase n=1 Tax=Edaphobacter aggregans TaxID=570835 RepID=UPI00068E7045|nr:alpha/beta fold hydrolase [Edaphobacter aggregans]